MAPQMQPNYPYMTSKVNDLFMKPLMYKYGFSNVIWLIVILSEEIDDFYIYEVNRECGINHNADNRPRSRANKMQYYVDYTVGPRVIIPPFEKLKEFVGDEFACSYDFILKTDDCASIDLDYVWKTGEKWKAIELTTLYKPLSNKTEAERLISHFRKRPSWSGPKGAHGARKLIEAADDLGLDYWIVCVNSKKGVSNELVEDGNAYWFPFTNENLDQMLIGEAPQNALFGTFKEMINWL